MKSMIENGRVVGNSSSSLLLHLAVSCNNVGVIESLLKSGCDVDSRDANGKTPLITALSNGNYEAARKLLDAGANIFVDDTRGSSALSLLVANKPKTPKDLIKCFFEILNKSDTDAASKAKMLMDADCCLEDVVLMKNAEVTRKMLEQLDCKCGSETITMKRAMEAIDIENVRVLVHFGRGWRTRRNIFERELFRLMSASDLISARPFVEELINWNVISESFLASLRYVFEEGTHEVVRMLLECKIDVYVKNEFGSELLVNMFGNPKVNAVELMENREFDVNVQDSSGDSALHSAVGNDIEENVRFLLDSGANPNSKDCVGWTPLFVAKSTQRMELLLQRGADLQCIDKDGFTIFDTLETFSIVMTEAALANLAIVEARGVVIRQVIRDNIDAKESFRSFYESCRKDIEWMKMQVVFESTNVFTVLCEKLNELSYNVQHREMILTFLTQKHPINWYFSSVVERKLNKVLDTIDSLQIDTENVPRSINIFGFYHSITARISSYLAFEGLLVFFVILFSSFRYFFV